MVVHTNAPLPPAKLHLPPSERAKPRPNVAPEPRGPASGGEVYRWRWYKPVSAIAVGVIIGIVAFVSLQSGESGERAEAAESLAPITDPAELRANGDHALALVSYRWHDLGYEIVFAPGQRDVRAQTDFAAHRITVFLARGDAAHRVAHDIGHELGHAYDQRYLTNADRALYLEARGKPNAAWLPGTQLSDYDTGAGDFAEVFASCYAASPEFRSKLAGRPPEACALIPRVPSP